jgi:hypothetical protein
MKMAMLKIGDFVETPAPQHIVLDGWMLLTVRMNHERNAVDSLRRAGLRAYYPSYEELAATRQVFAGRPVRRLRRVAIIPGHVLTPLSSGIDELIDRTVGAIGVVRRDSGQVLTIDDLDVQVIRAIEASESLKACGNVVEHTFKPGDKVRFLDDLTGRWPPGTVVRVARKGRIGVEVALMGRKVTIYSLPHQLERT